MKWYSPWTWVPFTREGRSTLVYLAFAGAGPMLTLVLIWAMDKIRYFDAPAQSRLDRFAGLSDIIAWSVFVIVTGLCTFVAFRALKVGKDGLEATGRDDDGAVPVKVTNQPDQPVPVDSNP